ncbi:MAG: EAL domain-containing protein [Kangiellaceae bacterium]|nr:EAL domain-containing protein [Kangiellaceae bacterium]
MHRLLARQLKRQNLSDDWAREHRALLSDIDQAYYDHDQERDIIERSLDLTSQELNERNQILRSKLALLSETHNKLAESLSVLNSIFDSTGEAIMGFDNDGVLLRHNRMASQVFESSFKKNEYTTRDILYFIKSKVENPHALIKHIKHVRQIARTNLSGVIELKNGEVFEFHSSAQLVNEDVFGRVWCLRNITLAKENEMLIKHQAYHDALTDLPNRLLLNDRLGHEISLARRMGHLIAVLFIDLDHFKKINDSLGHQQGDVILIEVAHRIKNCLRSSDTLARLGGDEFVAVLGGLESHKNAARTCSRIINTLQKPFIIEKNNYYISCSIGVSLFPRDDLSSEELIRKADLAMYHAKQQGKGCFQFFDSALERLAHYNLDLENNLRKAVKQNDFEVFYQPKIEVRTGRINGAEALLRWTNDDNKSISPAEFIPLAEQIGLIVPLGYWVIENVCQQIKKWNEQGIENIIVSINLSAQQFKEIDFVIKVQKILRKYNLAGNCLDWEITESILLEDLSSVRDVLIGLKELGASISIDDFGTGYSSLQYLQRLPVDCLKIDRSFIDELSRNPTEESLVNGIISLAHNLQLTVVAEGVEDKKMVDYLVRRNCDFIQGFYYYKPMRAKVMTDLLQQECSLPVSND